MTVRDIQCDFCYAIRNFTEMVFCPTCRKALCPRCAVNAPQQKGVCGRRQTCPDQTPHPALQASTSK